MSTDTPIIEVYFRGTHWPLLPGRTGAASSFGGPFQAEMETQLDLEKASLHHVAKLNLIQFGVPRGGSPCFSIPLIYGIRHEGCELEYAVTDDLVEITKVEPEEAQEGYPYDGYPRLLPYYGLGCEASTTYEREELEERIANTGWEVRDDCLYAIVRQHPGIGHCLFDPQSEVEIVYEIDPKKGKVRVASQCD